MATKKHTSAAKAQSVGLEALTGFYAVLSDYVSTACGGSVFGATRYDRWTGDATD